MRTALVVGIADDAGVETASPRFLEPRGGLVQHASASAAGEAVVGEVGAAGEDSVIA